MRVEIALLVLLLELASLPNKDKSCYQPQPPRGCTVRE